ncbi:tRNA pseudouridine(38-40) synthase TruA [Lacrimispora sp. NSJ-141]|uniref:tRNA pseudouridine synthase A n=1 Tax=Lientehia hominis TaxID=2897778 RepID=A0AAP2W9L5_9FIRM|nr:tRNA pseudouridine(38-40) synthase TruA [Lientehia hominis]
MKRIKLTVAYDGTKYCGWQYQPNGVTIEEVLNKALSELTGEDIHVIGASRTDSGVHALGNIAVFDTETKIPPEKICYAVNQRLPEDIVVQSSEEVDAFYHPRKCNSLKTYEYQILNRRFPNPVRRRDSYFVHWPLDVEKMQEAAVCLVGEHDFSSFCSAGSQAEDTIRKIYEASVTKDGDMITICLTGNGFLYNMVRIIAGTLIEVGRGAYPPGHMEEILNARDRRMAGVKAPAMGLTLISILPGKKPEPLLRNTNRWIDYSLYQAELEEKRRVYMVIHSCREEERERMIVRTAKQAFRDGAEELWVREENAGNGEETAGPYHLCPAASGDLQGWKIIQKTDKKALTHPI